MIVALSVSLIGCKNDRTVYLCNGPQSHVYHKSTRCSGLNKCSTDVESTDINTAISRQRRACRSCYYWLKSFSRFPVSFPHWQQILLIKLKFGAMKKYYVNDRPQANGDYEVHHEGCIWLPLPQNRTYLGEFSSCKPAVVTAKAHHRQVNGCKTCSNECHTQ